MQIQFQHAWRGRVPGQIDSEIEPGVVSELLRRGIAIILVSSDKPAMLGPLRKIADKTINSARKRI